MRFLIKFYLKTYVMSKNQFRNTFDEALSYFIKGSIKKTKAFALKCWNSIRYEDRKHNNFRQL
ncbi:hypothetical protein CM15mP35_10310 [bacterium]|nr:MAG: hypothetical protein CM15mP35_10310 [bacterium]